MKSRITHNLKLKILAFFVAVLVWMVVVNINNPVRTRTISGIPVTIENDSAITSEGKVYEILNNSNVVTIEVSARRSVSLNKDDFYAVANMQDIQLMKYVPITVICTKNVEISDITVKTPNLQISIEDSTTKTFPIVVRTSGEPGEGYVVDKTNSIASPESIRISGAVSAVDKISKVYADVDVSGLTMDTERVTGLKFYDENGQEITDSTLTYNVDVDAIDVSLVFLKTKSVPIKATSYGTPASGYALDSVTCEPSQITIAGTQESLDKVSRISIPSHKLSVRDAKEDVEIVVDIADYLPSNTQLAGDEESSVAITAHIEQLQQQTVSIPKEQIQINNVQDGMKAEFLTTSDISIQVSALEDNFTDIDVTEWTGHVDMSEFTEPGTYEVPLELDVPDGYQVEQNLVVVVKLSEDDTKTEETSEQVTVLDTQDIIQ